MYVGNGGQRKEGQAIVLSAKTNNSNLIAQIIVYLSLFALFNAQIRSIGHLSVVSDISLFPRFWLSDIGLLLPIIYLKIRNIKFLKGPVLKAIVLISLYGVFIAILRNNPLNSMGHDFRTIIAFFSGFSTILIMKDIKADIFKVVIHIELILTIAATAVTMFLPGAEQVASYERLTHPSAFILSDMPLIVFSTAILLASFSGKRTLIVKSWLCALLLIINAALITQTRSMALAVSIGIFFTLVSLYFIRESANISKRNYFASNNIILIFIIIILVAIFLNKTLNLNNFIERLQSGIHYYDDVGVKIRLDEIPSVFSKMTVQQHIFGMGLNPPSELVDYRGFEYNNIHIGIFNIWWRFGIVTFIFVNIIIIRALVSWLFILLRKDKRSDLRTERMAKILCTPSLLIAYTIALTSGGWSPSFTYGLGIALGIYSKLSRAASFSNMK